MHIIKNVLITGCSSGLGQAIYNQKQNYPGTFYPHYREGKVGLVGDICSPDFLYLLTNFLEKNKIDCFINNAAAYLSGPLESLKVEDIRSVLNLNVVNQILVVKKVYEYFKSIGHGRIVNINSLAGIYPSQKETIYCASKFALKGFSKALQLEALGSGIEIIDVYVGGMKTRMVKDRPNYNTLLDVDWVALQLLDFVFNNNLYINEIVIRKRNGSSCS